MIALVTSTPELQSYATHRLYAQMAEKTSQPVLLQVPPHCISTPQPPPPPSTQRTGDAPTLRPDCAAGRCRPSASPPARRPITPPLYHTAGHALLPHHAPPPTPPTSHPPQLAVWCAGEYGEMLIAGMPAGVEGTAPDALAIVNLLCGVMRSPVAQLDGSGAHPLRKQRPMAPQPPAA